MRRVQHGKVQHGKSKTRKECNTQKVQHEARKKCNMKQHIKRCNMKRVEDEKSVTRRKGNPKSV